ncbi:MAG: trypsin-like peptidase domain-containing protein [Oscillospiraceae bacterium]|nr:trypsin-like peptidase domain-containing protein [Oscillospiraceae bacterium]
MKKYPALILFLLLALLCLTACSSANSEPEVYEVRFEMNGGSLVSGSVFQRIPEGASAEAPVIERDGYLFDGWSESFDHVRENMVPVAIWNRAETAPPVYEVHFEMNGGTLVSGSVFQLVSEGETAEAPVIERDGYLFDGWTESFDNVTQNMVPVAMWTRSFRIAFDSNGGSFTSGDSIQYVRKGKLPDVPQVSRDYYRFVGWSQEIAPADRDMTYTALWEAQQLSASEIYEKISPAVVEIQAHGQTDDDLMIGSGFFVDQQGTLVTNYHVIEGAVSADVTLSDKSSCNVLSVISYDPALDLALLQTDLSGNACLTISDVPVSTGDTIYALGSSQGLTGTFSTGIVSSEARDMNGIRFIQITAPISEGNSGGPLVNIAGEVVGINAMTYADGQNLNFAIEISELSHMNRSGELTLQELYDLNHPDGETDEAVGYYSLTEFWETESNDTLVKANPLTKGEWYAGELSGTDDMDWFCIEISEETSVTVDVYPYYKTDNEYILCSILKLAESGNDIEVLASLTPAESEAGDLHRTATVTLETPGYYYIVLAADYSFPYNEALYYSVAANW